MIRVGVLGVGGMGKKRIEALRMLESEGLPVKYIGAGDESRYLDYETLDEMLLDKPDWVIVCLPHDVAPGAAWTALEAGVKVFMEKPMGRDLAEARALKDVGKDRLFVGMNYRFYPGVVALMKDIKAGWFGDLISVHMELGHGGTPGDEKTWKLDPKRAGSGALLDPGVHLLDLAMQIEPSLANSRGVQAASRNKFWKTGIFEETANICCGLTGPVFVIINSVVRWRNTFRVQVNGTDGYGVVERRGGNYGPQSYRRGRRWGWKDSGSHWPEEWVIRQADCSDVFAEELRTLFDPWPDEREPGPHVCTSAEALETMRLFHRLDTIEPCKEEKA
jgi:predicted dehydrogenase